VLDFAYIDPGAGSLIIQAALAAVLSIPFFFRNAIRSTLGRFRHRSEAASSDTGAATED
jgi:hypothetical protein